MELAAINEKRSQNHPATEMSIQMPDGAAPGKASVAAEPITMRESLATPPMQRHDRSSDVFKESRRWDATAAVVRGAAAATALVALAVIVSSEQHGNLTIFGLSIPLYSKWSFSESLEYLVGISAAVAAHSLLQLGLVVRKLLKKVPAVPSQIHAWILFAADQAFAYAMMSAGAAAAGVTNLNRTGIQHTALPDFCKPLHRFCNRMAISITFAFFSWVCLAMSAVIDVLWLSKL
ncbi:CASP-like protein [Carex littledalei]|uniref:CASP-like protein n=1 Tax=Carex littledalei TaxID=544730 RepID=A0A833R1W9_9POAL|nr:CASP-like protein [Carex littledalei]